MECFTRTNGRRFQQGEVEILGNYHREAEMNVLSHICLFIQPRITRVGYWSCQPNFVICRFEILKTCVDRNRYPLIHLSTFDIDENCMRLV